MSATTQAPSLKHYEGNVLAPISWKGPITYVILGLLTIGWFGFGSPSGAQTRFLLSQGRDAIKLDPLFLAARPWALFLGFVILALAGFAAYAAVKRYRFGVWLPVLVGVAAVFAFLLWSGAGKEAAIPLSQLLAQGIVFAVPLAFGSMAGLICERVGIINIAIEGQLLAGAFAGAVVATVTGNPFTALLVAPIAGALVGALLAFFSIKYRVDQIVVGVVLNVLVIGVTSYLFSTILKDNKSLLNQPQGCRRYGFHFSRTSLFLVGCSSTRTCSSTSCLLLCSCCSSCCSGPSGGYGCVLSVSTRRLLTRWESRSTGLGG